VLRAVRAGARIIGIIDGVFERVPSVWHKEILVALEAGVAVFGAASMGALRAAETDRFGMIGVGQIYEWYRDGVLEDDDEVAIAHASEEHGFAPLSEALVNVRDVVAAAVQQRSIGSETARFVLEAGKALFYPERSYPRIVAEAARLGAERVELERFEAFARAFGPSLKARDAMALLDRAREAPATSLVSSPKPGYVERTVFLGDLLRSLEIPPLPERDPLVARLVLEEAAKTGIVASAAEVQAESETFRLTLGLDSAKATSEWLSAHGLSAEDLRVWMMERVLKSKLDASLRTGLGPRPTPAGGLVPPVTG
jgi:hypothetical protein